VVTRNHTDPLTTLPCFLGPKRDKETGEWRKLHNEKLHDLYPTPNIVLVIKSRRMRWGGACSVDGEERGVYRVLGGT
jgi:hypothetical protein